MEDWRGVKETWGEEKISIRRLQQVVPHISPY
jgi:hypothetical protein